MLELHNNYFTTIEEIPDSEPCAMHSCLTAVASYLHEIDLIDNTFDPVFVEFHRDELMSEEEAKKYAIDHKLVFELKKIDKDNDYECIGVYIPFGDELIGVTSTRDVELVEADIAKKKAFVESVMSQLEEQAGHKVSMSQDELVAKLVETQDRNEELEEENEALKYENEKQSQAILAYREAMKEYVAQLNAKDCELEKLKQENFELQEALQLTEQELDKALYQLNSYKASDAYFKSRIEEIEQLKRDNSDMGMQVLRANIRAQEIADSYEKLKADTCDYEYLLKENEKLIKANEEYRSENVLLKNHVANIASQIEELEKEVRSITKRKHSA